MPTFFFFQAEDGIRAPLVTGVQTCALPISGLQPSVARARERFRPPGADPARAPGAPGAFARAPRFRRRSEERRVGKECRSEGSSDRQISDELKTKGVLSQRQCVVNTGHGLG